MLQHVQYRNQGASTALPRGITVVPPVEVTPRLSANASPIGTTVILATIGAADTGAILGEVTPMFNYVSWIQGDYGDAEMVFPANDPAVRDGLIAPGRRIVLRFDNGLPAWGGIIDVPVDRDGLHITVRAYDALYILKQRLTGRRMVFNGASPGQIMRAVLDGTNLVSHTGIEMIVGRDRSDARLTIEYNLEEIYSIVKSDVAPLVEWYFEPLIEPNIRFLMRLQDTAGRDLSDDVALVQGVNIDRPRITEQGPIVNQWHAVGKAGDWNPDAYDARFVGVATDDTSVARYGLRQAAELTSFDDAAAVSSYAESQLALSAEPYTAVAVTALNLPPGRFGQYGLGDTVAVEVFDNYGAGGRRYTRRVVGRRFDVGAGTCEVILQ